MTVKFGKGKDSRKDGLIKSRASSQNDETVLTIVNDSTGIRFAARSGDGTATIFDKNDDFGLSFDRIGYAVSYENTVREPMFGTAEKQMSVSQEKAEVMPLSISNADNPNRLPDGTMIHQRYRIEGLIGVGGFSFVYRGFDCVLNTVVAVKEFFYHAFAYRLNQSTEVGVNMPAEDYQRLLNRTMEEARLLDKFKKNPNIINIYDCIRENNTVYIVMELLEGRLLENLISEKPEGRMNVEEAIPIICGVLEGLEKIHKFGMLHRDIKPQNIVVTDNGQVKLFDFGAARLHQNDSYDPAAAVFTPGYAPPEQYGDVRQQGEFTDIYAAAATLYKMLTGKVPLVVDENGTHHYEISPAEVVSGIPSYVDKAIQRALNEEPALRFQHASDFRMALLGKKNVRSAEKELKHKKRVSFALILATVLLFGLGVAGFILYMTRFHGDWVLYAAIREDAVIEVWLPEYEDAPSYSESILKAASDYENHVRERSDCTVQVNTTFIPASEYEEKLRSANAEGRMPDIFVCSEYASETYGASDIHRVMRCLDRSQYIMTPYYQSGVIPYDRLVIGFDTEVLYLNDKHAAQSGVQSVDSLLSLLQVTPVSSEEESDDDTESDSETNAEEFYCLCMKESRDGLPTTPTLYVGEDAVTVFKEGRALALISSVRDYPAILEALPGYCSVSRIPDDEQIAVRPFAWCVHANGKSREAAALAMLHYLVQENTQDYLYLQNRDIFPVNDTVLSRYTEYYPQFEFIERNRNSLSLR